MINMPTPNLTTAHSLYVLYETLSDETKQLFLQKLLAEQAEKIEASAFYLAGPQAKREDDFLTREHTSVIENPFDDLFGILTATHSVSLEDMEYAISQQGRGCFNDCN